MTRKTLQEVPRAPLERQDDPLPRLLGGRGGGGLMGGGEGGGLGLWARGLGIGFSVRGPGLLGVESGAYSVGDFCK